MVGCGHPHVQDEVVSTEMNHRHVGIHMDSPWNPGPRETHGVSIANCSFTGGALKGGNRYNMDFYNYSSYYTQLYTQLLVLLVLIGLQYGTV